MLQAGGPGANLWHFGSRGDADDDAPGGCLWGHHDDQRDEPDHGHVHWPQQGDREAGGIGKVRPYQPERGVNLQEKLEGVPASEQASKKQAGLVASPWTGGETGETAED